MSRPNIERTQRRKLVLTFADSDDHYDLRDAIARVKKCGRAYAETPDGQRKLAAGIPLSKPCGLRICPHCERVRRIGYLNKIRKHFAGESTGSLATLTLKIPSAPSTWPRFRHERGLLPALLAEKESYNQLQRTDTLLATQDGPFRCGIWRVHCQWSINDNAWDVHRHLIVAGFALPADINGIRNHWKDQTGRSDPEAAHYEKLRHRDASFRYLSKELASTFASNKDHDDLNSQLHEAWSMAFNHPAALAEYLWTTRQRPCHFFGTFGRASAKSNR